MKYSPSQNSRRRPPALSFVRRYRQKTRAREDRVLSDDIDKKTRARAEDHPSKSTVPR